MSHGSHSTIIGDVSNKPSSEGSDGFEALLNCFVDSPMLSVRCDVKPPPRTENGISRDARFQLQHQLYIASRPSSAADWSPSTSPPSITPQPLSARASSVSNLPSPIPRRVGSGLNAFMLQNNN